MEGWREGELLSAFAMHALILLACVAFAYAAYVPVYQGYNAYDQKYGSASAANNAFQYGTYGQQANSAKDNKYGYVKGGNNMQHEEYHTATKHKIDEETHEITHKANNKFAAAAHQDHANKYGNAYHAGGNQNYAAKGAAGKDSAHSSASNAGALGYGYGAHNAHKVADNHAAFQHSSYANHGAAANSKHGANSAHSAASADNALKASNFVNHYELHAKKNEDYNHKEASHKKNKNKQFAHGYNAHAANGAGNHHSDYAAGHDSKHQNAYGHQNTHPGYYGGSQAHGASAAGAGHYDHNAHQGAYNYAQTGAGQYHGGNQKNHVDEKNTFKSVVRKVNKEEHEVKHDDGNDHNAYGNQYASKAHNNYDAANKAAHQGAQADSAYNKHDSHYAATVHQPAAHYYPQQRHY